MTPINQKFKPPKKDDLKEWQIVNFLIKSGYTYDRIYIDFLAIKEYPNNLKEAEEFVEKYKSKFRRNGL